MTTRPVLPLWVRDFLADTAHLTCAETGAYALLLMHAWLDPDVSLPDDDRILARLTQNGKVHNWLRLAPNVRAFFTVGPDGRLRQKRLTIELEKIRDISADRKKAAEKRWGKSPAGPVDKPVNSCGEPAHLVSTTRRAPQKNRNANDINGRSMQEHMQTPCTLNPRELESLSSESVLIPAQAPPTTKARNIFPFKKNANGEFLAIKSRRARAKWEAELARTLGPPAYAEALEILATDRALCDRATAAEIRQPGAGAHAAIIGLRNAMRARR